MKVPTRSFWWGMLLGGCLVAVPLLFLTNALLSMQHSLRALAAPSMDYLAGIEAGDDDAAILSLKTFTQVEAANIEYAGCAAKHYWFLWGNRVHQDCGHIFDNLSDTHPSDFEMPYLDRARERYAARNHRGPEADRDDTQTN